MSSINRLSEFELFNIMKNLDKTDLPQIELVSKKFNKIGSNELLREELCKKDGYTSVRLMKNTNFTLEQLLIELIKQDNYRKNIKNKIKEVLGNINQINIFDGNTRDINVSQINKCGNLRVTGELDFESKKIQTSYYGKLIFKIPFDNIDIINLKINTPIENIYCGKLLLNYCICNSNLILNKYQYKHVNILNSTFTRNSHINISPNCQGTIITLNNCLFTSDFSLTVNNFHFIKIFNCKFDGITPITINNFSKIIITDCEFTNEKINHGFDIRFNNNFEHVSGDCSFYNINIKGGISVNGRIKMRMSNCNIDNITVTSDVEITEYNNNEINSMLVIN